MYAILLKFADNRSNAPLFMEGHNAWIKKGFTDGIFQCVGSLDTGGGFVLAHGEDQEGLSQRVQEDPFVENNVVTAEVHRIDVKRTVPELAHLAEERQFRPAPGSQLS
ncbi:YciI family protein [Hoeflea prorocentri]|uniref:YCII-related domain-containing protein n=1 Tax=Hoeflea prorocentri TaxID=1922333 RepID=A0A9X3UIS4_9HYPH|nr:hypothetical protein [Hoeflea prorocentri]MCY6379954.1 hypothetical protein [Hoeflea prorocentri]MDA5397754.1 hypothetical protein [Hoeflea prorocentri]